MVGATKSHINTTFTDLVAIDSYDTRTHAQSPTFGERALEQAGDESIVPIPRDIIKTNTC